MFDCDVHPRLSQGEGQISLTPYLPKAWKERFDRKQAIHNGLNVPIRFRHPKVYLGRPPGRTHSPRWTGGVKARSLPRPRPT